jgi:hypothetical protein
MRYLRYIRYMAGQRCSGWVKAARYVRYILRSRSGRSGWRLAIRYTPLIELSCGFVRVWRM